MAVKVRSGMRTVTGVGVRIKSKSSRAGNTSISVRIPHSWSVAANTVVASIDMSQSSWADTGVSIVDVIGWANFTSLRGSVPP